MKNIFILIAMNIVTALMILAPAHLLALLSARTLFQHNDQFVPLLIVVGGIGTVVANCIMCKLAFQFGKQTCLSGEEKKTVEATPSIS